MAVYSFVISIFMSVTLFATDITPYLLPEEHPIKSALDGIFSKGHVLKSPDSLKKAGFNNTQPKAFTQLIVTTHPNFPGYIFKIYLDCQRCQQDTSVEHLWMNRIQGAESIRQTLDFDDFKVPHKWIYALPKKSSDPRRKRFILVEEDMNLMSEKENISLWKSAHITEELLDSLYEILETNGMKDCAKPDNVPFSKDGKIAFVDTATHHQWSVSYHKLNRHLSSEMKMYWKRITLQE